MNQLVYLLCVLGLLWAWALYRQNRRYAADLDCSRASIAALSRENSSLKSERNYLSKALYGKS